MYCMLEIFPAVIPFACANLPQGSMYMESVVPDGFPAVKRLTFGWETSEGRLWSQLAK